MAINTFKGQDACAGDSGGPFVLIKGQNISKGSLLSTMNSNQTSAHFLGELRTLKILFEIF